MIRRIIRTVLGFALILGFGSPALLAQAPLTTPLLDANKASEAEMARLPHLNATLAKSIVARRPFKNVTELDALLSPTLSRMDLTELYGRLFVPVELNTATDAEILLIPGIGNRMLREFKEYRPYAAMAQFRREIGKYVSAEEVARFERYVYIK
jgi:radical SAM superfamily enzyme with C-terminal helix-hairpin-helix motif